MGNGPSFSDFQKKKTELGYLAMDSPIFQIKNSALSR